MSESERKVKQKESENIKKLLEEKEWKLAKLRKQQPKNLTNVEKNKDNNKLNWAIGLGIAAIVIGLLCLLFLLCKKKD